MDIVRQEVDRLYKKDFGRLVTAVLYSTRDFGLEGAEDIVHDTYAAALKDWGTHGIPENPTGWLYKVCRHKALNKIRKEKKIENLNGEAGLDSMEIKFTESILEDHQLKLLFACAHPDLAPKAQVVITLKYVINLKVEAIAKILGMTIDGIDKLLLRARQKIRDEKILFEEPITQQLGKRLAMVHKVLYLIFNEGYKSSWGKQMIREELCEDALIMTKTLIDTSLANKETYALYALMLFNAARFKSRFGALGELLDLEHQDRSLWNKELILLAKDFLLQSRDEEITTYHVEASIAYVHCSAANFQSTDWNTIRKLYEQLLSDNSNPFIELNYAIAMYHAGQTNRAFEILNRLHRQPVMNQYSLLNTTLGKFYQREGAGLLARKYLEQALKQTSFIAEKNFIAKMIDKLSD
jgi:RNA polymerase sigma factor (sigma-70 family)